MSQFYIKTKSIEPVLKMKLVQNGRSEVDTLEELYQRLINATITFSMKNENGVYKIYKKSCGIISKPPISDINNKPTYFIFYAWQSEDVDEPGVYIGEFEVRFFNSDGQFESNLIVPIREPLKINILP